MVVYVGLTVDGDVLDVDGGVGGNVVVITEDTFCADGCVGAIVVCPIMGIVVSSGEFAVN